MGGNDLVMVRHGETAWSLSGRHTGRTDIPLTERGAAQAAALAERLAGRAFALVLTSPRARARQTCELAGFGDVAEVLDDLAEWDYGDYEGLTTAEIRAERPGWTLWDDGAPDGETAALVAARVDRVLARVRAAEGDVLVFSHGHLLRVLAARWLGLEAAAGRYFVLDPASFSVLGWEREQPVIAGLNKLIEE
jgi:broad specificity phosphatase PhoE